MIYMSKKATLATCSFFSKVKMKFDFFLSVFFKLDQNICTQIFYLDFHLMTSFLLFYCYSMQNVSFEMILTSLFSFYPSRSKLQIMWLIQLSWKVGYCKFQLMLQWSLNSNESMDPNKIFMAECFAPMYYGVVKIIKPKKWDVAQNEKIPLIMHCAHVLGNILKKASK